MKPRWIIIATTVVLLIAAFWLWFGHRGSATSMDDILLLLPDGTSFSDPRVTLWLDAASEEGLHVVPMQDSEFVRPFFRQPNCAGIILPDSIHQRAGDSFIAAIRRFVLGGGQLMLVFDAGTLTPEGKYPRDWSRLSDLAGIDYALYDQLHDNTIRWGSVATDRATIQQMNIPPGKYFPFQRTTTRPAPTAGAAGIGGGDVEVQLRRYKFGELNYPSFVTSGSSSGRVLFHSPGGVVASEHAFGKGSVLFVNLPLGYLKANTDGLLLHAFLQYFAVHTLSLPALLSVPDGIGGLVLNWHVDSNAAIKPLEDLRSWALLRQGRFSIHVTAGPDASKPGDHFGFDVPHNALSQQLIREHIARGDEIGSHGGWIHDYFSAHVDKDDPKDLEKYLVWNKDALEAVTHKPVVEYSAPNGNQPKWVTHWLDTHGFVAYYYTGDSGMAPTQGYRDGVREGQNLWAFPVAHLNQDAAFEEMVRDGYPSSQIQEWLQAMTDFAAGFRTARLVYFHPPGIVGYRKAIDNWMRQTSGLEKTRQFRWYTMTELARFLNSRKQVSWNASQAGGLVTISATHPQDLQHETWRLSAARFSEPVVVRGSAQVTRANDGWMVVAGPGQELQFETKMVNP
ncbi:MAG: polysaccharide deacetylase family protein [Acidobacteriia bacterium]|nr:polysaccharide deacetylase family protein [Terriglobia bacterium]